ncbi:MAG: hypothetical protein IPN32_36380 [Deltaproteobacteria bacterium]|nr:hypothetical protein [Deltaproteobacteria bacterium]
MAGSSQRSQKDMADEPARSRVDELQERATKLLSVIRRQARRPFVVELAGTPKAGKTTVISMLENFFDRCGYKVRVIREQAPACPLPMKGHFFFNTWTTTSMLGELLEVIDTDDDLVILDRGLFDALVWLDLQRTRDQITDAERSVFESFVGLERWRKLIDAVVILRVSPDVAMDRENRGHLVVREGSMMNHPNLAKFNERLDATVRKNVDMFPVHCIDADAAGDAKAVTADVVAHLLDAMSTTVDPTIACFPRDRVVEAFANGDFVPWDDATWESLCKDVRTTKRSHVEESDDFVQLVACGIATHGDRVLVFDRGAREPRTRPYDGGTIWQGQHVEHAADGVLTLRSVRESLARRFLHDLHLAVPIGAEGTPLGLVWDPGVGDGRHLGIAIPVEIENATTAEHLRAKKFRTRGRRPAQQSKFVAGSDLRADPDSYDLEPWSRAILRSGWPRT